MTRPLRIALLTHSLRPRGGVVHTLELADALHQRGHAVTVLASAEPGERLFREVRFGFDAVQLPPLTGDLQAQVRQRIDTLVQGLPPLLARGCFDVLHAQDSLSGNALALLQAGGAELPPWLRTVHHLDVFDDPTLMAWQARAWRAADDVACVSDTWAQHFQQQLGVPVRRMFNGVNLQRYQHTAQPGDDERCAAWSLPPRHDPSNGPVCLLVGGVEARKNTTRLLQAFAWLRRGDPAWAHARLVVAGGASMLDHGSARHAWALALAALNLAEGPGQPVLRTGPLPDDSLPALMRRADVLAMPSLMEGFGLAALEALACGTPVLVSQRPPFTEHLADEPAATFCDPEDIASIAAGLQRAVALPRPPHTPRVCLQHSWQRSARLHEAWYLDTLTLAGARHARNALHPSMA